MYRYVAPRKSAILPAGQWNSIDVECARPQIKVTPNGELIVDLDQSTVPELRQKPLAGYLCLQNYGVNIEFRSIRVRDLAGSSLGSGVSSSAVPPVRPGSVRTPVN